MKEIKLKAYAKINLGLDVIGRMDNGYHSIKTVMQTVELHDDVRVMLTDEQGKIEMSVTAGNEGIDISDVPTDERNLCVKAARLVFEMTGIAVGLRIELTKCIPSEAGMAGGSTDAAAVMVALNELLDLGYKRAELADASVKVGADIPYCIMGGTMLCEGVGERLTAIKPPLKEYPVVLVKPDFGSNTKEIYEAIDTTAGLIHPDMEKIVSDIKDAKYHKQGDDLSNIMEIIVMERHPEILTIKEKLLGYNALAAAMTGSGTCVYGLFEDEKASYAAYERIKRDFPNYFSECTHIYNGR